MPTSLVLELQALAQSSAINIPKLLSRAKVVAWKLGLTEPRQWIDKEINGYSASDVLPKYRQIPSVLNADVPFRGLVTVEFEADDGTRAHFSSCTIAQPAAQLASLLSSGSAPLIAQLNNQEINRFGEILRKHHPQMRFVRVLSRHDIGSILAAVQDRVLTWSLDLEAKGILGGNMTFTSDEKEKAASSTTINHIGNQTVIHASQSNITSSGSGPATTAMSSQVGAIAAGADATASGQGQQAQVNNDIEEVRNLVGLLVSKLHTIPEDKRGEFLEHAADLQEEAAKGEPKPSKLKAALGAIRLGLPALGEIAPDVRKLVEEIAKLIGS